MFYCKVIISFTNPIVSIGYCILYDRVNSHENQHLQKKY